MSLHNTLPIVKILCECPKLAISLDFSLIFSEIPYTYIKYNWNDFFPLQSVFCQLNFHTPETDEMTEDPTLQWNQLNPNISFKILHDCLDL